MTAHSILDDAALRRLLLVLRLTRNACYWFDTPVLRIPKRVKGSIPPEAIRGYVGHCVQQLLYDQFYCTGRPVPLDTTRRPHAGGHPDFLHLLAAANHGRGSREHGWRLERAANGQVVIARSGLELETCLDDLAGEPPSLPGSTGTASLRVPSGLLHQSPGFYIAVGDTEWRPSASALRIYWNLRPLGAVDIMDKLTHSLNGQGLPFRLKCLVDPLAYGRCDSSVLYVRMEDWFAARDCVVSAYTANLGLVGSLTPPFTKRLAPGLALSEDPPSGESFGWHRCGLLAEGLVEVAPWRSPDTALLAIATRFQSEGLSADLPYLNSGSVDRGEFGLPEAVHAGAGLSARTEGISPPPWLECAHRVGRRICEDAIWDSGRCAWMGYVDPDTALRGDSSSFSPVGPEVYNGSAGIALFLSLLFAETGDATVGRTALGAAQHALSRLAALPRRRTLGLFDGRLGILFASAVTGTVLQSDLVLASCRSAFDALLARLDEDLDDGVEHDLFSGLAGGIVSLLMLRPLLPDGSPIAAATRLGLVLVAAGNLAGDAMSWQSPSPGATHGLLGFSHGAAGIACALLDLWRKTGEDGFKRAALAAFAYERIWFDPAQANWPDFRLDERKAGRARGRRFTSAWCHGAPGIALSRWRAHEVLQSDILLAEARVALETTAATLRAALEDPQTDFCLCHGLAGNADVLLSCRHLPADGALAAARRLAEAAGARIWESGVAAVPQFGRSSHSAGDTPGLMLGLAGLGWFFLRLAKDAIPSILPCSPHLAEVLGLG